MTPKTLDHVALWLADREAHPLKQRAYFPDPDKTTPTEAP